MAKAAKALCDRCEAKITAGISFCDRCGGPTKWASHEERVTWELSQWKSADRSNGQSAPSSRGTSSRRWMPRPFARKTPAHKTTTQAALTLVPPKPLPRAPASASAPAPAPAGAAAPAASKPMPTPARVPAAAVVRPAVKSISRPQPAGTAPKPTPKIERGPRDAEPLTDAPATVRAMRLLNARVAELDARVRHLEGQLAERDPRAERLSR